jgi:hypothetical protein
MTEEQKSQLGAILEIEGFTPNEIAIIFGNIARIPREERGYLEFMSKWKLETETKQ